MSFASVPLPSLTSKISESWPNNKHSEKAMPLQFMHTIRDRPVRQLHMEEAITTVDQ